MRDQVVLPGLKSVVRTLRTIRRKLKDKKNPENSDEEQAETNANQAILTTQEVPAETPVKLGRYALAEPALVVAPEPKRGRGRPKKNATVAPPAEPEQVNVQDRPILRARRIHK
jgi:hypothetical protein